MLVDVEINVKDESYQWFLHWMSAHQRQHLYPTQLRKTASNVEQKPSMIESILQRLTPGMRHLSIETEITNLPNGSMQTKFALVPGPGKHILRYKNAFVMVERMRETKAMSLQQGRPWETITLTTLYSHRHIFEDIFIEAHRLVQQATEGKIIVYRPTTTGWERFGEPRRKRGIESVILDKGIGEKIVEDVRDFLGSAKWYYDRGIPYRRGYLLHGPPGTGKTSFIQALAGELDYNIAMLNLSQRGLTDDRLQHLLSVVPTRTIVLLEDADAAFGNRRVQTDSDGYQGANVTYSGLLNALDGVGSSEERILFLTTNHVERLDAALVRPGRVDMTVRLGDATRWQVECFWDRFYGELDPNHEWKAKFLKRLEQLGIIEMPGSNVSPKHPTSTAALQGLFLYNKDDMEGAISMAGGLLPEHATLGPERRENSLSSQAAG
jgi:mitochondrial chaperone BCS1